MTIERHYLEMMEEARHLFGDRLLRIIDGLPADEQIELLLKLSCTLACTSIAGRPQPGLSPEKFYSLAAVVSANILADLASVDRR